MTDEDFGQGATIDPEQYDPRLLEGEEFDMGLPDDEYDLNDLGGDLLWMMDEVTRAYAAGQIDRGDAFARLRLLGFSPREARDELMFINLDREDDGITN